MAAAAGVDSKSQAAERIAQWATQELGFRRKATLVTAKGEEQISGADIEPLLQGELATVLDLAATHLVSLPNALKSRRRIAAYCAQASGPSSTAFWHVDLRHSLVGLREREETTLAEIKGRELENQAAIQNIDDVSVERRAVEARIRELRLQMLKKQLIAENTRRMASRMKMLIGEMNSIADAAPALDVPPEVVNALMTAPEAGGSRDLCSPRDLVARITAYLHRLSSDTANAPVSGPDDQLQQMVANVISCLKMLEDHHLQRQKSVEALRTTVSADKEALANSMDEVAGQLNMSAAVNGDATDDYAPLVFQAVLRDALSRVSTHVESLVPASKNAAGPSSCVPLDYDAKATGVVKAIEQTQSLISAVCKAAAEVCIADGGEKEARGIGRLVVRSSFSAAKRDGQLGEIAHAMAHASDQSHEALVGRLGAQIVQGLRIAHMMRAAGIELGASHARLNQLAGGREVADSESTLEGAVDALCRHSTERKAAASAAMAEWAGTSSILKSLQTASDSADTEETIARLSDAR
ncbi:hypothetical protein GGF46_003762 [Coemansia sp. RSA 552]|nr:hypothetical protein GGF46_003762 [Coemansia sp. RSA 552]